MAADLDLLDEIYNFCVARAKARAAGEEGRRDWDERRAAQSSIQLYADLRRDVLQRPWTAIAGIDYFRLHAMRDRDHPDFRPEWTIDE